MKVYLVGGAVRDELLGLPIKEKDWVVVGATPEEMINQGFKKVGRDFPVFLHPKTHEEYALARTERKTGKGYTSFVCYSDPSVTLEDDLKRRDLTINAMAKDLDGKIVDPYNGYEDLKRKILRHVSTAFSEDPVRILRVARFESCFGDFKVHPETNQLMQEMLAKGEVDALVPERVWQELERALKEQYPERFFTTLKDCKVLPKLFPEIDVNLKEVKVALKEVVPLSKNTAVRFAAIAYNLGKKEITDFCKKYRLPNVYRELSLLVFRLKGDLNTFTESTDGLVTLLEYADSYRKPERIEQAMLACQANNKELKGMIPKILEAYDITKMVKLSPEDVAKNDKSNLRQILHEKRREKLESRRGQVYS